MEYFKWSWKKPIKIGIGRTLLFTNYIVIEIAVYLHTLRKLLLMDDGRVYDQNQQCYQNSYIIQKQGVM